jgi:uncharacterized protein YjhX (UPF0386 family)
LHANKFKNFKNFRNNVLECARRYFKDAPDSHPQAANEILVIIARLYAIEQKVKNGDSVKSSMGAPNKYERDSLKEETRKGLVPLRRTLHRMAQGTEASILPEQSGVTEYNMFRLPIVSYTNYLRADTQFFSSILIKHPIML